MPALLRVSDGQNLPRGFCLGQLSTQTLSIGFVKGSMDHLDHRLRCFHRFLLLTGGSSKLSSLRLVNPLIKMALMHKGFQISFEGPAGCCEMPLLSVERAMDSSVLMRPFGSQLVFGKGKEGMVLDSPEQQVQRLYEDSSFCNELVRSRSLLMPGPDVMHRSRVRRRLNMME